MCAYCAGMLNEISFDNIGIAVTDLDRTADFYRTIGFGVTVRDGQSATAEAGSARLFIFRARSAGVFPKRPLGMDDSDPGIDHISFAVPDVDQVAATLGAAGVEIESGPIDQPWGRRTITVLDPDGIRLWFLGPIGEA